MIAAVASFVSVARSRIIAGWPRVRPRERHVVSSVSLPLTDIVHSLYGLHMLSVIDKEVCVLILFELIIIIICSFFNKKRKVES